MDSMRDLGVLSGDPATGYSTVYGISADGSTLVGRSTTATNGMHAFRWSEAGGMLDLGAGYASEAYAANADGSVIVGSYGSGGFRWTSSGLLGIGADMVPKGVSADGSVVVGYYQLGAPSNQVRAFRWTAETGMVQLGTLDGLGSSQATAISADGNTIVGFSHFAGGSQQAFRWTESEGMVSLGNFGGNNSTAYGVSADGSVIVGYSTYANGDQHAYRWTAAGGMVDLGTLFGYSVAQAVNADGSVIVGYSSVAGGSAHAYRWTESAGLVDLGTLGGTSSYAYAVSGNGLVAAGASRTVDEVEHAFQLAPIPPFWAGFVNCGDVG